METRWGLGRNMGLGRSMVWGGRWVGRETADELWKGNTLLKTGVLTDTQTHKSENSISASFTPFTWRIY